MAQFKNTQGIEKIEFKKSVIPYCPLGQKSYVATMHITFIPGEIIMDYLDVEAELQSLEGKHLLVEDCAEKALEIIKKYQPRAATVMVETTHAGHFDVSVTKTYREEINNEENK